MINIYHLLQAHVDAKGIEYSGGLGYLPPAGWRGGFVTCVGCYYYFFSFKPFYKRERYSPSKRATGV